MITGVTAAVVAPVMAADSSGGSSNSGSGSGSDSGSSNSNNNNNNNNNKPDTDNDKGTPSNPDPDHDNDNDIPGHTGDTDHPGGGPSHPGGPPIMIHPTPKCVFGHGAGCRNTGPPHNPCGNGFSFNHGKCERHVTITVHHTGSSSSGSSHSMSDSCYNQIKLAWMAKIQRGQNSEVDRIIDDCMGVNS